MKQIRMFLARWKLWSNTKLGTQSSRTSTGQHVLCVLFGMRNIYSTLSLLGITSFLCRGLAFTCQALQNMQNDRSSELHSCFKRSYDTVLRHHHTFFIRSVVLVRYLTTRYTYMDLS